MAVQFEHAALRAGPKSVGLAFLDFRDLMAHELYLAAGKLPAARQSALQGSGVIFLLPLRITTCAFSAMTSPKQCHISPTNDQ